MAEKYDLLVKLIVIGNSGTGKSSLLHRFIEDRFVADQSQTIGVEFGAKVVPILGSRVKVQIWDTAGQERYRSVTRSYYRGATGALCVYDITSRESYDALPQWIQAARDLAGPDIVIMMVGNKADVADAKGTAEDVAEGGEGATRRRVTHLEASTFAQENQLMMMETSAATGEYVEDAFVKVAKNAMIRMQETGQGETAAQHAIGIRAHRIHLEDDEEPQAKAKAKCCKGS
eukprot:EG_transcript_13352